MHELTPYIESALIAPANAMRSSLHGIPRIRTARVPRIPTMATSGFSDLLRFQSKMSPNSSRQAIPQIMIMGRIDLRSVDIDAELSISLHYRFFDRPQIPVR